MTPFEIKIEDKNDYVLMHLSGSSTAVNRQSDDVINLRDKFKDLARANKTRIIVDLSNLEYIASDTIGALLSGNSIIKKKEGNIALCNASPYVLKIFEIVRLADVIPVCNSLEEAQEAIKN